jgi:hypothetical protein
MKSLTRLVQGGKMMAPSVIPRNIAIIKEAPLPPEAEGGSNPPARRGHSIADPTGAARLAPVRRPNRGAVPAAIAHRNARSANGPERIENRNSRVARVADSRRDP